MSPEAQLHHEHALHDMQQAEVFQQPFEDLHQYAEAVPHIHDNHEHHGHDNHIGLKEAHACAPDCPEHGGGHHDHATESHTSDEHHGHEHGHHESQHTISRKAPEHACSADCPEHSYTSHEHHDHHEHGAEKQHAITQKAPKYAGGADCPEHGHAQQHSHTHEHTQQPASERVHMDTRQEQAEALQAQRRIEHKLHAAQPAAAEQAKPATPEATIIAEVQIHEAAAVRQEEQKLDSITADPAEHLPQPFIPQEITEKIPVTTEAETRATPLEVLALSDSIQEAEAETAPLAIQPASEGFAGMETPNSAPFVTPAEAIEQPVVTNPEQAIQAAADHEQLDVAAKSALLAPLPTTESQPATPQETIFDISALLIEQESDTADRNEAQPLQNESESLTPVTLPELPVTLEPLPVATATVAQTITERYQKIAEMIHDPESDAIPLQPAQLTELRSLVVAIQSRSINVQPGTPDAQPMVTPREFVRLLQLLGFENSAQTLEGYIRQHGYGLYDDLLARLFELLQYAKPIEAPTLTLSAFTDDQTNWVHALGKAAVLLGMFAKLRPSRAALRHYIQQPEGAVNY